MRQGSPPPPGGDGLKGQGHHSPDEYFILKAYEVESVIYVRAPLVVKFFGYWDRWGKPGNRYPGYCIARLPMYLFFRLNSITKFLSLIYRKMSDKALPCAKINIKKLFSGKN